jgi:signal transduction histidine kinase
MRIIPGSIQGRLSVWLILFTSSLLLSIAMFLSYEVRQIVLSSIDRLLHSKMQLITGLLHEEDDVIELEVSEIIAGEYAIPRSGHYYKVILGGRVLAASPSLVDREFVLEAGTPKLYDEARKEWIFTSVGPDGEPIRVLRHDLEFRGMPVTAYVAENLTEGLDMMTRFRHFLLIIIPVSIVCMSGIGLLIAHVSLKPLALFSSKVRTITHTTLSERLDQGKAVEELTVLAYSFNEMLDRLQRAFENERRLISDASHELKTPVSVIKAQCDVVFLRDRTKDEYLEALETIRTASNGMVKLVRDLLTLARLDSGMFSAADFRIVSLGECVGRAVTALLPLAERRAIRLETSLDEGITILGDSERLTEALLNIIENAVRYNRDGGLVEITSWERGDRVGVEIRDTGVGIGSDELERIFERFYRTSTSRSVEGTGLGLSIARCIIEAHRGEIRVESEPGIGSCFSVSLPQKPE